MVGLGRTQVRSARSVVPIPQLVEHSRLDYLRRGTQLPEELTLTGAKAKKYYITGARQTAIERVQFQNERNCGDGTSEAGKNCSWPVED